MFKRLLVLVLGTMLGGWLCAHLQLGISGYWGLGSDELSLVGFVAALSVVLVLLLLFPLSVVAERLATKRALFWAVLIGSVVISLLFGLWFYAGFLGRPLERVLQRELPFIPCFALIGIGYALSYRLQRSA